MKKAVLTVIVLFVLSSVGFASPLMDYSKGKAAIDITYRPNLDVDGKAGLEGQICEESGSQYWGKGFDAKGFDWGITLGMGKDFAIQYRQHNSNVDLYSNNVFGGGGIGIAQVYDEGPNLFLDLDGKVRAEEFNVLYKIDKKVAAFAGVVRAHVGAQLDGRFALGDYNGSFYLPELRSKDETMIQAGLLGSTKIADKTNAFGLVAIGNDYRNWEAGLSYELAKDWEFNVNYRHAKFDKFKVAGVNVGVADGDGNNHNIIKGDANVKDVTVKGWGFGFTYKF